MPNLFIFTPFLLLLYRTLSSKTKFLVIVEPWNLRKREIDVQRWTTTWQSFHVKSKLESPWERPTDSTITSQRHYTTTWTLVNHVSRSILAEFRIFHPRTPCYEIIWRVIFLKKNFKPCFPPFLPEKSHFSRFSNFSKGKFRLECEHFRRENEKSWKRRAEWYQDTRFDRRCFIYRTILERMEIGNTSNGEESS